ncbi:MAG: hypothetical protein QOF38_1177, partial [Pseudonocardiales bacterium]|nr:hypothetical protein [Pseudonocardiales bacterium]
DVLRSGDALSVSLHGREAQIASLERQFDQTMQGLSVDGGKPLSDTLDRAPDTCGRSSTTPTARSTTCSRRPTSSIGTPAC